MKATNIIWSLINQFGQKLITVLINIILARFLSPEIFGEFAIVSIFLGIAEIFIEGGYSQALIQRRHINEKQKSSVFYLNLLGAVTLYGLIFITAPWVDVYYETNLTLFIRILSLSVLLSGFNVLPLALLNKEFKFKSIAIANVIAHSFSGILAIYLVYVGFGLEALVAKTILYRFILTIIIWVQSGWWPNEKLNFNEVRELSGYSVFILLSRFITLLMNTINRALIGKVYNFQVLGLYFQAEKLNMLSFQAITLGLNKVVFSHFSSKDDNSQFMRVWELSINLLSYLVAVVYILSPIIVQFLLGEKWEGSIVLFQLLTISALFSTPNGILNNLLKAKGYAKQFFNISLILVLIQVFIIVIVIYVHGRIEMFLLGRIIAVMIAFLITVIIFQKSLAIQLFEKIALLIPLLITIIIIAIDYLFHPNPVISIGILSFSFMAFEIKFKSTGVLFLIKRFLKK